MTVAFILAAGSSTRFGAEKIFAPLWGFSLIQHSIVLCQTTKHIESVYIACRAEHREQILEICKKNLSKPYEVVIGGATRFESTAKLVEALDKINFESPNDFIVVLNAANPLATADEIERAIKTFTTTIHGVAVGRPIDASVKQITKGKNQLRVSSHVDRELLVTVETPQVVRAIIFFQAIEFTKIVGSEGITDELSLLGAAGFKTTVIGANQYNRKITSPVDYEMMSGLITAVGVGEDSHEFVASNKPLILGGVRVNSTKAFAADSDGDVILHAIANALSSAMGGNSLGTFATAMCEDGVTDSREYIKVLFKKAQKKEKFLHVASLSVSVEGSYPKIDPLVPQIRESLAELLNMTAEKIGITATTGKKLSSFGKGKGVKVVAFILLRR